MWMLTTMLMLLGCNNFDSVRQADTIQAYETWITENPDSRYNLEAESRLEDLYIAKAKETALPGDWVKWRERFPESTRVKEVEQDMEISLFAWASKEDSVEGWQRFLELMPSKSSKWSKKARALREAKEWEPSLIITPVTIKDVNLAENPEGPMDGKGFYVDVTNTSQSTLATVVLRIDYLSEGGEALDSREWPVVAPRFPTPVAEEWMVPMGPGETRTWEWTTGDLPDQWSGRAHIKLVRVREQKG